MSVAKVIKQSKEDPTVLDDLTPEEVEAFKSLAINSKFLSFNTFGYTVAEGDSWFDFLPGTDIIDCLRARHKYQIQNFAKAGDTLENMILGNVVDSDGHGLPANIQRALKVIQDVKPNVFLFSGGGNDVAGDDFVTYLNHHNFDPDNPLRVDFVDYMFNTVFQKYLEKMLDMVKLAHADTKIVMHGYGYPIPTGKGVGFFGFNFVGPWLLPGLLRKKIPESKRRTIIKALIDQYNDMLKRLSEKHAGRFIYVDLRQIITDTDWRDELHLKNSAYARVSDEIHRVITLHLDTDG
jgi:lysophospholipase L1-like esterase